MAKGIIVVNAPENCKKCEYRLTNGYCIPSRKDIFKFALSNQKPDWCPIRQMPERKAAYMSMCIDSKECCENRGYNACIDEILKGADKNG